MKLILLGAPGSGKGTQAGIISKTVGIPVISTGAILRAAVKAGTELGRAAKEIIDQGGLVSDDIVIGLVRERLAQSDCEKGYILDGVPRTIPQAEALEEQGVKIDYALTLEISDEVIKERVVGRRICNDCGGSFHVSDNPPKKDGICDDCGGKLIQRKDDMPETVENRLELFHKETAPLERFYGDRGKLLRVQSQEKLSDTTRLVMTALGVKDAEGIGS